MYTLLVRFFVTPSDSVAIIAANAVDAIPYFSAGLKGVARFSYTFKLLCLFFSHQCLCLHAKSTCATVKCSNGRLFFW